MRKFLAISLLLGSSVMFAPQTEAKTTTLSKNPGSAVELNTSLAPQWQRNRRMRVVNRVRIVRRGFRTYREVWQYRYFANGRVTSRMISRIRIR